MSWLEDPLSNKGNRGIIETVVVPIDVSSESALSQSLRAVRPASVLAEATKSELVAVSVAAKLSDRPPVEAELSSRLVEHGIPVSRIVVPVDGYAVGEGIESATYGRKSLVVVATRGHGRNRVITGSVAEELIHARPQYPTVLVGPNVEVEAFDLCGPMVLCVDPDRASETSEQTAAQFARQLSMELLAVSVVPQETPVPGRSDADASSSGDRRRSADSVTTLEGTRPSKAIADYAEAVHASLIVAGTHQRADLSRLVFGSVAIETVTRAHCPVMAVHELP